MQSYAQVDCKYASSFFSFLWLPVTVICFPFCPFLSFFTMTSVFFVLLPAMRWSGSGTHSLWNHLQSKHRNLYNELVSLSNYSIFAFLMVLSLFRLPVIVRHFLASWFESICWFFDLHCSFSYHQSTSLSSRPCAIGMGSGYFAQQSIF